MTQQDKFEQWWCSPRESFALDMTQEQKVDMWVWEAWQAATQAAQVEIEIYKSALKAALAEKAQARCDEEVAHNHSKQLQLNNQKLREALSIAMVNGDYLPAEKAQLLKVLNG